MQFTKFRPEYLKADFIAGLTVALILIPQSLAYAQLAGLPAQFGLYASLLPPVIAAFFGSSKQLATGPVAVLSLMTAAALSTQFTPGSADYVSAAIFLAFLLGILQFLFGVINLGGLVSFLSHPVIYGFTNAAALIIATTQLSKFFGVTVPTYGHHYETVAAVIKAALIRTEIITLLLGLWSIFAIYTFKKINKKIPAVLATVILSTLLSILMNFQGAVIGNVPAGLPILSFPHINLRLITPLLPTILTMAIIGFTEAVSVAQAISVKTKDTINPNKELLGQGMGNILGSLTLSYPTAGSFSRSAVNFQSGAKTELSSFFTSLIVFITLLFFTRLLYFIPQVVLAAVIVFSVSGLLDFKKIKNIWYTNPFDAYAAILTFLGTLYFAPHLEKGILIGVIFSITHYLYRSMHPRVVFLSKYKDGALHDATRFMLDRCRNIAVVRLDAPLFFANSAYFENEIINDLVRNQEIKHVLIHAEGINHIDATGEEMLKNLFDNLNSAGKSLYLAEVRSPIIQILKQTGLYSMIKPAHFFSKSEEGIKYIITNLEKEHLHKDSLQCPLERFVKSHPLEKSAVKDKRETIAYFYKKLLLHKA